MTSRQRSIWVGIMIILAYAMLTYTITGNRVLGIPTDIASGLAVIFIPILMRPMFDAPGNRGLNMAYMAARFVEGALMIGGGIMLAVPACAAYRNDIYQFVHIWFFIAGAMFFYALLYRTKVVPRYIPVWGFLAALGLLLVTVMNLFAITNPFLEVLVIPMILNELFLAIWLMVKGLDVLNDGPKRASTLNADRCLAGSGSASTPGTTFFQE